MTNRFISTCDVCRREERECYVLASPIGPMSLAYCVECYKEAAEPEWSLDFLWGYVGTRGEGLAESVSIFKTWKDGRYWTWDEWSEWRATQPDPEDDLGE